MNIVAIIPCRFRSKRFPGKPLALIKGYPLMWYSYNQSLKSKYIKAAYIATDDLRIKKECIKFGLNCLMTKKTHLNGTDRIAECIKKVKADIYVNVQGDEPLINPNSINAVIKKLLCSKNKKILATNAYHIINDRKDISDTNVIKTIFDKDENALAFSRNIIPYNKYDKIYFRQIGLYAFTQNGLSIFAKLKHGPLEKSETIEMYRILENGYSVKMVKVKDYSKSVDTPQDLEDVKKIIKLNQ